jgi:NAD(P)-dependent dehydrogenase (short-subunit alcohol dehydrogenase family)
LTSGSLSSSPGTTILTTRLSTVEALAPAMAPARVNAVPLGLIDTPLLDTAYDAQLDTLPQNRAVTLPGRRVGAAEEVAQVIRVLMINDYVPGEVVHVDGDGRFV